MRAEPTTRFPWQHATLVGIAIVAASWPAWSGDWIYDDWIMRSSSKMDDIHDLLSVFNRPSSAYLDSTAVGVSTYRPLSMATLIAVQTVSTSPLPHHLLSLALHLLCVGLLGTIAYNLRGPLAALCVAIVFGLHPLGVEAYGWINGRSDVLACLGVGMVACGLLLSGTLRRRSTLCFFGSCLAAFSKETSLVALLGISLAALTPDSGVEKNSKPRLRRDVILPVLACWIAAACFMVARAQHTGDTSAGPASIFETPGTLTALGRLAVVVNDALLIPMPRTMGNLGYALSRPAELPALLLLAVPTLVIAGFLRNLRALLLVLFAALAVAPCIVLRHAFWHGLDRYLYVPLFMLCLAWIVGAADRQRAVVTSVRPAAALVAVILALGTWFTAETYSSTPKHILAMIELRPEDPTGYLIGSHWLSQSNRPDDAHNMLERIDRTLLPAPHAATLATQLNSMGRVREAHAAIDDMARRHADDPYAQLSVLSLHLVQARLDEAFNLIVRMRDQPRFCHAALQLLDNQHFGRPDDVQRVLQFQTSRPCR